MVDIGFIRYNPVHPGARHDLFPRLRPEPRPLVYNFLSTCGYLPPEVWTRTGISKDCWHPELTDYYRFALSGTPIDGLLCAPDRPEHVDALADAMAAGPLTAEECDYLIELGRLIPATEH
jgi:hypothetical protein